MAALVAAKAVEPPLSIGVFGEWGSGKSFFLSKLGQRVEELGRDDPDSFWPNIAVIEFNAWNYVDANLWASLVAHLFDSLRVYGQPEVPDPLQAELENLAVARAVHAEAQARYITAKNCWERAQKAQEAIDKCIKLKRSALAASIGRDIWNEIGQQLLGNSEVKAAISKLAEVKVVGDAAADDLQTIHARAQEVITTAGRMRLVGLSLMRGNGFGLFLLWIIFATVFAISAGAILFHFTNTAGLAGISAVIAQISGLLMGGFQWIRGNARNVLDALNPVEKARECIERQLRVAESARQEESAKLQAEIEQELQSFQQAKHQEMEAKVRLDEAHQAVNEKVSGELIQRFIRERVGSGDYAKHLGLISMIRGDFQRLSDLMVQHNSLRNSDSSIETRDEGINRIVLLIDDLDRCPTHRVAEVLEAVFLLLAFRAFVVVVAVDLRWISQSLLTKYDKLLFVDSDSSSSKKATPRDYLEKIFQIPYRVRAIDSFGFGAMIDSLTEEVTTASESSFTPADNPQRAIGEAEDLVNQVNVGAETSSASARKPRRSMVRAMHLTSEEIVAMKQLVSLAGRSPRATKRFVNIYRLIKASLPSEQLATFENEEYRAAMLLLATKQARHQPDAISSDADSILKVLPENIRSQWIPCIKHISKWQNRVGQFSFDEA